MTRERAVTQPLPLREARCRGSLFTPTPSRQSGALPHSDCKPDEALAILRAQLHICTGMLLWEEMETKEASPSLTHSHLLLSSSEQPCHAPVPGAPKCGRCPAASGQRELVRQVDSETPGPQCQHLHSTKALGVRTGRKRNMLECTSQSQAAPGPPQKVHYSYITTLLLFENLQWVPLTLR